ncbi:hypothetical protein AB0I51_39230 [Streptomyces sp. NPDC050549]|uniref:hypothetical protein n=1 Tax=Streptomyces sp. NPDC050549 TaxID=3155406 RepID=UPI00341CBF2D
MVVALVVLVLGGFVTDRITRRMRPRRAVTSGRGPVCMLKWPEREGRWRPGRLAKGADGLLTWTPAPRGVEVALPAGLRRTRTREPTWWREALAVNPSSRILEYEAACEPLLIAVFVNDFDVMAPSLGEV